MPRLMRLALTAFFISFASSYATAALVLPDKPLYYVNDYAQVLTTAAKQGLEKHFKALEERSKHQAVVAVFPSLEGDSIEDVATRLFEKWRLGSREHNDGILLILAVKERDVRIEVGYGLEAKVPDALAGRIIQSDMIPYLRQGQVATAILSFERRLEEILATEAGTTPASARRMPWPQIAFVLALFALIAIKTLFSPGYSHTLGSGGIHRPRRNAGFWWGGFGGGGGGFGGGGFGGGGGGLSGGGGASGRW